MKFIKEEADMERKDIRVFTVKVSFAFTEEKKMHYSECKS